MDISEGTTTDDLWTPYKELVLVVESYLGSDGDGAPYAVHTFESVLRRHKQTFLALFKNPPKNPASREEIRRGITEGVTLPSIGRTLLSKELVDEAIIISDMYNVSEYLALELLHTAQRQMPRHPGLPRGLVAIILYYDGKRALAHALKEIIMAQDGVCWCINGRDEIVKYVSRYAEQLASDGVVGGALDALARFTLEGELRLLQHNRALPPHKHHAALVHTIQNTRKLLAGVVFAQAAQRGLNRDIIMRILSEQSTSPSMTGSGSLDEVSLALQMALLYALDLSVLYRREDGEELAKKLPLVREPELLQALVEELSPRAPGAGGAVQGAQGGAGGVRALAQLCVALALCALKRAPPSARLHHDAHLKEDLLDQDELLVDAAIDGKVFEYLDEAVASSPHVCEDQYYQRRLHTLITDFIVLMHSKLMEMRVKAEESARSVAAYAVEGLRAPAGAGAARAHLDALLRTVERLYAHDPHNLRLDYWPNAEGGRPSARAAALQRFAAGAGGGRGLRALAALAVPVHTWALLQRRDALSAHHAFTALARYYCNLRADPAPFSVHAHSASMGGTAVVTPAARPGKLLVRQEEVEAMIATLKLIAAVARVDHAACASICENLQWDAVNVMFGLVSCHIPVSLKAELLLTLGALGGTAATAPRVWAALEHSALVTTDFDKCPLAQELNEVECRMEEYPVSSAFLELLWALCRAAALPMALGAGARVPGLQPYLRHVLNRLALPAPHRAYRHAADKWQVLSQCLKLFALWLDQYEPSAGEWSEEGSPAPGFELSVKLHSDTDLLRLVLDTVDDTYNTLDTHPDPPGKKYLEECLESSLQILERALALERPLQAAAAEANRSLAIIGLSKLMLAPVGAESRCRVVTWCRAVSLAERLPTVCVRAVELVNRALGAPAAARHVLAALSHRAGAAAEVRHGFVQCLEAEEWPPAGEHAPARRAKLALLDLLQRLLGGAPPNLAHFLLGYRAEEPARSVLHEAGAGGAPRTALHAVLDALESRAAPAPPDALAEACYRLVYSVAAHPAAGGPLLRLLRARDYFVARHVRRCGGWGPEALAARSWVLRLAAVELGAAGAARAHAALGALLGALEPRDWEACVLRRALAAIPLAPEPPATPRWELFEAGGVARALAACETGAGGARRVSVARLRALLARELAGVAAARAEGPVAREVRRALEYAAEVNRHREVCAAAAHCFDSWRQLVEMVFCAAPSELLEAEARRALLLNVVRALLEAVPPAEVPPQVGALASGTVLLLLVDLRRCYLLQRQESTLEEADFEASFFGASSRIVQTNTLALKFILRKILDWILVSSGCPQRTRVNLYGALLNFLNLTGGRRAVEGEGEEADEQYSRRLDAAWARAGRAESATRAALGEVVREAGAALVTAVCADCLAASHHVCRMLALACLDTLLEVNPTADWMNTLTDRGYLRSLIDSLLQDDKELKETLEPNPVSLRALYVYESKMALMMKIASTRAGAESALAQGVLAAIAELKTLDAHPDLHAPCNHHTEFVPPPLARFRQIVVMACGVCSALVSALGAGNRSCGAHVWRALGAHADTLELVLRAAHPSSPPDLLLEVEALTGVVARAAHPDLFAAGPADAPLLRCRALMLALLPRFHQPPADPTPLYFKIVFNLLTFARNIFPLGAEEGGVGGACVSLTGALTRLHHHQEKLLATDQHRLHALPTMTLDDIKKLVGGEWEDGAGGGARGCGASVLRACVEERRRALRVCGAALHLALALLHAHLRRLHAHTAAHALDVSGITPRSLRAAGGEEMLALRKELIALFNDRFTEELLDTTKNDPPSQRGFLEVVLKDIKSMIQFSPL